MGSRDNMRISSLPYTSPGPGFPDMPVPTWLVGPYLAELWAEAIQPLRVTLSLHPLSSPPPNLFCSLFPVCLLQSLGLAKATKAGCGFHSQKQETARPGLRMCSPTTLSSHSFLTKPVLSEPSSPE